ncbi:MAG: peroxiredoxin family protein [Verrucomicrobiales bacterium]
MARHHRSFLFLVLALAGLATAEPIVVDKDDVFRLVLKDWEFGDTLFGEKITTRGLKGKVVAIHYWAVGSPKCEALLPQMAQLDNENRALGLVIIGAEKTGADKVIIKALMEKNKVGYSITDKAQGPPEEVETNHVFVFDEEGECIYDGNSDDPRFKETVKKALEKLKKPGGDSERPSLLNDRPRNLLESRGWKNADGREITAAVQSADDKNVTFLLPNGQRTVYPLDKLSPESMEAIKAARDAAAKAK